MRKRDPELEDKIEEAKEILDGSDGFVIFSFTHGRFNHKMTHMDALFDILDAENVAQEMRVAAAQVEQSVEDYRNGVPNEETN